MGARVRKSGTRFKLLASLVLVVVVGAAGGTGTWAAFTAKTANTGNQIQSGTVAISDDDGGSSAMFSLTGLLPTDTATRCIVVTYGGSLPASVRLYGATTGTGLDPYLSLVVTRGTISSPSFSSCTGFTADATNYVAGEANGVIYDGSLQGWADTYAAGLVDPNASAPESWTNGEAHAYKFEVTMQDTNAAPGKTATQQFTWEARNE